MTQASSFRTNQFYVAVLHRQKFSAPESTGEPKNFPRHPNLIFSKMKCHSDRSIPAQREYAVEEPASSLAVAAAVGSDFAVPGRRNSAAATITP
jgi:hypothetical protein